MTNNSAKGNCKFPTHGSRITYSVERASNLFSVITLSLSMLLVGCQTAPRVIAELTETLPSRSTDSVMIYKTTDNVPASARKIGTVKVKDGGLTPTKACVFSNMLALAVKKTAESGGNGFHIDEHKYPGIHGSTCHRVFGTMYLLPDSLITSDTRSVLENLEMIEDNIMEARASKRIADMRTRRLNNPNVVIKVNAGPSWITSEYVIQNKTYKSKRGFGCSMDFQHFWGSGLGVGFNYQYFGTSFDEGISMRMHYFGANIAASLKLGKKWRSEAFFGGGLAN